MRLVNKLGIKKITAEQFFVLSFMGVSVGNYAYNLILGRILGPELFAEAAILVTFLMVVSFLAMTFQVVTTKFSILFEPNQLHSFTNKIYTYAVGVGIIIGVFIFFSAEFLQKTFNTSDSTMFQVFGFGVPFYFIMSVNRGQYQGSKKFKLLSVTYQLEMLSRLVITLILLYLLNIGVATTIALGIVISFVFGLYPFRYKRKSKVETIRMTKSQSKQIRNFFILTAFYELTQIIINNSDILMVKHYFDSYEAGLYASLALIGRVVYFISWTFIMLLLPKVVELKKKGENPASILFKYAGYISILSFVIILGCLLFPEPIINIMFGNQYQEVGSLLWKYALATSLFALSNIFAYYYLSLDQYKPVIISALLGVLQMVLVIYFHDSLDQVIKMQITAMLILLIIQVGYFVLNNNSPKYSLSK